MLISLELEGGDSDTLQVTLSHRQQSVVVPVFQLGDKSSLWKSCRKMSRSVLLSSLVHPSHPPDMIARHSRAIASGMVLARARPPEYLLVLAMGAESQVHTRNDHAPPRVHKTEQCLS